MRHSAIGLSVVLQAALAAAILSLAPASAQADPPAPAAPATGEKILLATHSYWRAHVTLRPTLFGHQGQAETNPRGRIAGRGWSSQQPTVPPDGPRSPLPPADWMKPDFDDATWWRDPGPFFGGATYSFEQRARPHESRYGWISQPVCLALLCARGRFIVDDPAQVRASKLKLSVEFRGGAAVYLNGVEVARSHLPAGPIGPETLADDYPKEAYVDESGGPLYYWNSPSLASDPKHAAIKKRAELRVRAIRDLALPADRLRAGVNVLAVEVHRAALDPLALKPDRRRGDGRWNTVALLNVQLSSEGGGGGIRSDKPAGAHVWVANPAGSLLDSDYGDAAGPAGAVRIVAARNGLFSGQVVVNAPEPIRNLKASIGAPAPVGSGATLPPVRLRYSRADLLEGGGKETTSGEGRHASGLRFDALLDAPPPEAPLNTAARAKRASWPGAGPWLGAVQPIWLTAAVPRDAAPGLYRATLKVAADNLPATSVPVEIKVSRYRLPDPADLATWVDFVQSPDSLAEVYHAALWSEPHWALVRRSMEFLAEVHNRTLYVPLICRTNHGNSQSMVRWIPKADGSWDHDFSVVERYLATAKEAGLSPAVVCFQVWDYHVGRDATWKIGTGMYGQTTVNEPQPVPVSRLDPAGGQVGELAGPKYGSPGAEAFWRPVADGLRERMRRLGWEKSMFLGLSGDYVPPKSAVDLWAKLWPGVGWSAVAHGSAQNFYGVPVGYMVTVWQRDFAIDPALRRNYGWKRERAMALFDRYKGRLNAQLAFDRVAAELSVMSNLRGPGRMGLDTLAWRSRYPGTNWGSLTLPPALLAAGPDGPVSTCRFEMFREGLEECAARISIERALTDESLRARLGAALADRCQAVLDERTRCILWSDETNTNGKNHCSLPLGPLGFDWYAGSDWQGRSRKLFAAAAEVADRLADRPAPPPRAP